MKCHTKGTVISSYCDYLVWHDGRARARDGWPGLGQGQVPVVTRLAPGAVTGL
jgi:hypothetical protein